MRKTSFERVGLKHDSTFPKLNQWRWTTYNIGQRVCHPRFQNWFKSVPSPYQTLVLTSVVKGLIDLFLYFRFFVFSTNSHKDYPVESNPNMWIFLNWLLQKVSTTTSPVVTTTSTTPFDPIPEQVFECEEFGHLTCQENRQDFCLVSTGLVKYKLHDKLFCLKITI